MSKFFQGVMVWVAAVMLATTVHAQQLTNADFEDWSGTAFNGEAQPKGWNASHVEQVGMKFNFAHKEAGRNGGYCMMVQDQLVGAMGITDISPGYFSIGKPWSYLPSITQVNNATAGTSGGQSNWHYRPDSMEVWIKRTGANWNKEDYYLLYYAWVKEAKGTSYKGKNGSCTNLSETNEESDIRIAMNGNECSTTVPGEQVCEGMWRERANYNNWTRIVLPIYYFNDNTPNYMNIIFSASNYPNFRATDGLYEGNSLYVDDVSLIYSSKIQKLYVDNKEWKGFDPNSTEIQYYSLGENATAIPTIEAMRGAGSLTNAKGTTKSFPGRKLSGNEITIVPGDLNNTPTVITVKAEDNSSTTTYRIQFQKAASSNAKLAGISVDGEALTGFSATKYNYSVDLPYGTNAAPVVTAEGQEDAQVINITQPTSVNGTATIKVTAANKTATQTYTINFKVGLLADNELQDILVNGKSIPGFNPSQTIYKVSLPMGTTQMPSVTYVSKYPAGEQTVVATAPSIIDGGQYTLSVTTPGNQIAKVYKLNFKLEESSYSYLKTLEVAGGYIANFQPDNFTYYINLPLGTTAIPDITYTVGDEFQTVAVTPLGAGVLDGTVRVTVTAGNGDQSVYKLVFSTEKSDKSTLNNIFIGGVALEGFSPDVTSYNYVLPVGTTALPEITWEAGDEFQTVSPTYAGPNGKSRITVTAGDGSTTIYIISFSVETFSVNTLADLAVEGYNIGFQPETNEYWVNLPQGTTSLPAVSYTLVNENFQTASVRPLTGGLSGDYKITVRPSSGASRTYIIHFSVATSTNVDLSMIYVGGTALENFDAEVTEYEITLPEGVSKIPAVTFDKAETSQRVLSLLDGRVQTITVTAQSGATRTYTITFIVTVSENAYLEMIYLGADSVPLSGFVPTTLNYEVLLEGATCPLITVKKAAGQQVTITAPYGAGVAQIRVQPEQGAANIYEITFKAGAVATARLSGILVNGTTLATFSPTTLEYDLSYAGALPTVEGEVAEPSQTVQVLWKGDTASLHVSDAEGNKAAYVIHFHCELSADNALEAIYANGVLINGFAPEIKNYEDSLEAGSAYPEISYKAAANAQVVYFGQTENGKWAITVLAENGTPATYTVRFVIRKYNDATLKNLLLDGVQIAGFDPDMLNYVQHIDEGAKLPKLTVEAREGQTIMQGNMNDTLQQVIVLAESGATKTYTVTYNRVQSSNALLADILINGVSIEGFAPSTTHYEDSIDWRSRFVPHVFPVGQLPNQTITTYFSRPNGTTKIHVVAQDGVTSKDYFVAFPVRKSNNTALGDLYLSSEDAEIAFIANKTDYEVILPYDATICPQMVFEKDEPVQRIDVISRPIGQTSQIIVTAENGDTRTYNILFKREVLKTKNLLSMIRIKELDQELSLKDKAKRDFDVEMPFGSRSLTVEYEKSYEAQTVFIQPGGVHNPTIITVKANNDTVADEIYTINPIVPTADPAVLTDIKVNDATIDGFEREHFSYIVKVTDKPILRYTLNKGAEINILDQTSKHWKAEVTYGNRTNTYEIWYYYQNDVIPNANLDDWSAKTKYNNKSKPNGWNVIADAADKYITDKTGAECQKASDGSVYLPTTYRTMCCRNVPAFMALGTISGKLNTQNAFTYSGGIVFRNSPDYLSIRYKAPTVHNSNHLIYILQGTEGEFVIDSTDTKSFNNFKVKTLNLRGANEAAGEPTLLNIVLNSYSGTTGGLGAEGMGTVSEMYVDWLQFSFNHTLTAMKVDEFDAAKSGNAFSATLTDPERIELPVLSFTGEVADQAQDVTWAAPVKDADFEIRTATIRNWAENGVDYSDYTLTVKRPLDTRNKLANLLLDTVMINGFAANKTDYVVTLPASRRNLPDIQPVPSSSLQQVTTSFNPADSTVTITVTPEKGDAMVYTVKFTSLRSNDVTLTNIIADGLTYDPDVKTYELAAEQMPVISFVKKSDLQEVSLQNGVLTVTAEDGTKGTYTITRVDPVIAPNGTIKEFSLGDNVIADFGATNFTKDEARPAEAVSFIREQDADSVIFVQTETQMTWAVPGTGKTYTWSYPSALSNNTKLAQILMDEANYNDFVPELSDDPYEIYADTTLLLEAVAAEDKQHIVTTQAIVNEDEGITEGVEYTIAVTAEDGVATRTYRVRVLRPKSNDASLAGIMLDSVLIDGFDPATESYTVTLPLPADGVKRAQPQMPNVSYVAANAGQKISVEPAQLGEPIVFTVESEDRKATKYYYLTVNAEPSHCVDLTGITVNGEAIQGDKDEHFEAGRHFYSLSLKTSQIDVDYTSDDRFQKVTIVRTDLEEGSKYRYVLHVEAEDGITTADYQVNIYVENKSNDRTLANITLDGKDFVDFERALNEDLAFDPDNNNYTINLPSGTTLLPEVNAQLKMDGQTVEIYQQGDSILLNVTAVDGTTKNQYVLHFVVPLSKNANLGMIFLDGEPLPSFDPAYYFYQVDLPVGTYELPEVVAQKAEVAQKILSTEVDTDKNQVTIKVQAEDPATRENTYVVVFRFTQSDADTLAMIYQDGKALETFAPQTKYYALTLPVGTMAFPELGWEEADDWQTVTMDTVEYTANQLIRQIIVTSESGRKNIYTVSYTIEKSDVDWLQMIFINQKQLADFDAATYEYYYELTASYAAELNGQLPAVEYLSGDEYQSVLVSQVRDSLESKSLGYKTVITVTAATGATRTYTIHYPVQKSGEATLNMINLAGKPLANYDAERFNYRVEIDVEASVPVVTVIKKEEIQVVEITINEDVVTVLVTAEDGTQATYTLTFERIMSSITTLQDIILRDEEGVQLPAAQFPFRSDKYSYTIDIPYSAEKPLEEQLPSVEIVVRDPQQMTDSVHYLLPNGDIQVDITVTAPNGENQAIYSLVFHFLKPTDATLVNVLIKDEELVGFLPLQTEYMYAHPYGSDSTDFFSAADVQALLSDPLATYTITDNEEGTIFIRVVAQDGNTEITYTIFQSIAKDNDCFLSAILLDGDTISNFASDITFYTHFLREGATAPGVEAIPHSENAEVSVREVSAGDTCMIIVTADDGSEMYYYIHFAVSSINEALEPTANDIVIKRLPGTNQLFVGTIRKDVHFALFDQNGRRLFYEKVPTADPNDVDLVEDLVTGERLNDVLNTASGLIVDINPGQIYFYTFLYGDKTFMQMLKGDTAKRLVSGKIICQ